MPGLCGASVLVFTFILHGITAAEAQATTPSPAPVPCAFRSNTSCSECLQNVTCLWCIPTQQCIDYPVRDILPDKSVCPLSDARWGLCWVNFQILIIAMSVLGGILLIALIVFLLFCCKCERIGNKREDAKAERQARARKARQKENRNADEA
uniref:PTTG1 interacting protein b isoform X2 n=1 Tax=Monopterus albus TaxID=43700 RepID=UPI0009B32E8C|nr:pituitary tumor-transforming gene 1 protein-interacting protein-like isoform X2 [Monopterus albus]